MTFGASPSLTTSAVELFDDDGRAVATIYAGAAGIEILPAAGVTLEAAHDISGGRASIITTRAEVRR